MNNTINFMPLVETLISIFNPTFILSVMGNIVKITVGIMIVEFAGRIIINAFQNVVAYGSFYIDSYKEGKRQKYFAKYGKIPNW